VKYLIDMYSKNDTRTNLFTRQTVTLLLGASSDNFDTDDDKRPTLPSIILARFEHRIFQINGFLTRHFAFFSWVYFKTNVISDSINI
jgi:hypothetical protein